MRAPTASVIPSSQAVPASAAASKKQYAPGIPLGGLPMLTRPVGSCVAQAQVPTEVPISSR